MTSKSAGDRAEARVAELLSARGCKILERQYRCRYGEIDLIALDGGTVCFVEVKMRSDVEHGLPREFVTLSKQKRLRMTAQQYLAAHDPDAVCRFDVAEVYADKTHTPENARIEYLENAF